MQFLLQKLSKTKQIYNTKKQVKKAFKNWLWQRLGLYLGGFGRGFGRDLETLGASWVVFGALFFMLVFGMVFKSGLGGFWARFWPDFTGVGKDFGKVRGGFWAGFFEG